MKTLHRSYLAALAMFTFSTSALAHQCPVTSPGTSVPPIVRPGPQGTVLEGSARAMSMRLQVESAEALLAAFDTLQSENSEGYQSLVSAIGALSSQQRANIAEAIGLQVDGGQIQPAPQLRNKQQVLDGLGLRTPGN